MHKKIKQKNVAAAVLTGTYRSSTIVKSNTVKQCGRLTICRENGCLPKQGGSACRRSKSCDHACWMKLAGHTAKYGRRLFSVSLFYRLPVSRMMVARPVRCNPRKGRQHMPTHQGVRAGYQASKQTSKQASKQDSLIAEIVQAALNWQATPLHMGDDSSQSAWSIGCLCHGWSRVQIARCNPSKGRQRMPTHQGARAGCQARKQTSKHASKHAAIVYFEIRRFVCSRLVGNLRHSFKGDLDALETCVSDHVRVISIISTS